MDSKKSINDYFERAKLLKELFGQKEIELLYDNLAKKQKTNQEMLYLKSKEQEIPAIFVFGFDYFLKELEEQEFKKILGQNSMNFKIYMAYDKLCRNQKKVKISDIVNEISKDKKDSLDIHKLIRRILTLGYYLNWNIEKDSKDIEGDSFVEITNNYLIKLKQRYNFDIFTSLYEDKELMLFVNSKGKLNAVFKQKNEFIKKDIEQYIARALKKSFNIKNIILSK